MRDPAQKFTISSPKNEYPSAYAIPSHMDDNQKIVIQARHGQKHKVETIDRGNVSMFAQQMASLVGPAYVGAFATGTVYGVVFQKPDTRLARTRRLLVNSYLNNVGKTATRFANNSAAAVLLYIFTGKMINFLMQEEFDDFNIHNEYENAIYGAFTGALYKSTRGQRAVCLGAVLGAAAGSSYGYLWRKNFFYGRK